MMSAAIVTLVVMVLTFTLIGKPESKGAHTSFVPKRGDGSWAMRPDGSPMVVTKDTNPRQILAQGALAAAARAARVAAGAEVFDGPVIIHRMTFYFDRAKKHFGTGRNATLLKEDAPLYPVTKADVDKLERLVLDAMTGTIIKDDKQVVGVREKFKLYTDDGSPERTEVEIELLDKVTVGVITPDAQMALAA